MNLYNNDEENKNGMPIMAKGGAPYKKTSIFGKAPLLSRVSGGIMDRIKNLSRRDMAFVGIGLSVLVMAPVAEFVMSKPASDNMLTPGFGSRDGASGGVYEPGINALSQGSPDGSSEVITPLSSRDPSSLILGSQPAQPAAPPPSMPDTSSMGMRDAIKDAGRAAFSEATKSAGAPTPIPRMQAGLRSAGSFFSGGEGTRTAGTGSVDSKITEAAKSASSKAAKRSMVGPVASAGYKGVSNSPGSVGRSSALEKARAAADKSASFFTGAGASNALDKAAAEAVNIGRGDGGMGAGGESDKTKSPSNSSNKNSSSSSGESLAQAAAKARQQKALEWEFYKQYEIPKQIYNAILTGVTGSLQKLAGDITDSLTGQDGSPATKYCWEPSVCVKGDCAEALRACGDKCKNAAGIPDSGKLCEPPQGCAMGQAISSAGKDKGDASVIPCTCGSNVPNPTRGSKCGATTPGGNPGATTYDNSNVTNPSLISSNTADAFSAYDNQLVTMVTLATDAEKELSKKVSGENKAVTEVTPAASEKIESLKGGFTLLATQADGVKGIMATASAEASKAVDTYTEKLIAPTNAALAMDTEYKKYQTYFTRLQADADKQKVKPATIVEGLESYIEKEQNEKIKAALTKWKSEIDQPYTAAQGLIAIHNARNSAYGDQLAAINRGVTKSMGEHATLVADAGKVDGTPVEKLAKLTGRPQVGTTTEPQDSGNAPLKKAAVGLRGLDYKVLFEADHKRISDGVSKAEVDAWKKFDDAISNNGKPEIADPDNFVAEYLRSKEIVTGLSVKNGYAADFTNVTGLCDRANNKMVLAKAALAMLGVNACYFTEAGCGTAPVTPGNNNPPAGRDDTAFTAERTAAVSSANSALSAAVSAAAASNKQLQDLKPAPGNEAKMAELKKVGGPALEKIKASEEKIKQLIATMEKCTDKACIATQQGLIEAEMKKIAAAQAEIKAAYDKALPLTKANTPAAPKPLADIKAEGTRAYNRIMAAYNDKDGKTKWANFPKGDQVNALRTKASDGLKAMQTAQTGASAQHDITEAATEKTRAKATAALADLKQRATKAEQGLKALKDAYAAALKVPVPESPLCYKSPNGCSAVTNFYLATKFYMTMDCSKIDNGSRGAQQANLASTKLRPACEAVKRATSPSVLYADWQKACDTEFGKIKPDYSYTQISIDMMKSTCKQVPTTGGFFGGSSGWFQKRVEVELAQDGRTVSNAAIGKFRVNATLSDPSNPEAKFKVYTGAAQNIYNMSMEISCSKRGDGTWKTDSVGVKIDKPTTTSKATGVNASVGPSFAKVGASYTYSVAELKPYGDWTQLGIVNAICGSDNDGKVKVK